MLLSLFGFKVEELKQLASQCILYPFPSNIPVAVLILASVWEVIMINVCGAAGGITICRRHRNNPR
jgi:hypothetical protein